MMRETVHRYGRPRFVWTRSRPGIHRQPQTPRLPQITLLGSIAVLVAVAVGRELAKGNTTGTLFIAACYAVLLIVPFTALGWRVLPAWIVLAPLAYPWLRYPHGRTLISFDRVWIVAAAVSVILLYPPRRPSPATRRCQLALLTFGAAFLLRALTTRGDVLPATEIWIDAMLLPILLFLIVRRTVVNDRRLEGVMAALTVAGVVLALLGIAETVGHFSLASLTGGQARIDPIFGFQRVSGPFPDPEPYALAMLLTVAASFYWLRLRGNRGAMWGSAAIGVQLLAIGLTYFRAAWISEAIVVIGSLALVSTTRSRRVAYIALGVVFAYATFLGFEQSPALNYRITNQQNVSGRLATYQAAEQVWATSPWVGVGVNQFENVEPTIAPMTATVGGVQAIADPHSTFFAVLAEMGVLGFAALIAAGGFAYLLVRALRRVSVRRRDRLLATTVGVAGVAYLVMSLTLTMVYYGPPNALFAVLLGCAAARLDAITAAGPRPGTINVPHAQ